MTSGELTDFLEHGATDRRRAAAGLGHTLEQAVVCPRVVEFLGRATGVCHAVGIDDGNVAGFERQLGLLVRRFDGDSQGEAADLGAVLLDPAVRAADEDRQVTGGGKRQAASARRRGR